METGQTGDVKPGGGVVSGNNIRLSAEPAAVPTSRQVAAPTKPEPRIELIREGDVIQAIDVICSCGQRIRLKCNY